MLFNEIVSAPSLWLRGKRSELQVVQQRKMSEITANEQRYGRNVTGILLVLVNSAFFSADQCLNFFKGIIEKPQLFIFFVMLAATPFEPIAVFFMLALQSSFINSVFTFGSFVRTYLEPTIIEVADDVDDDNSIFTRYSFLRVFDAVLGIPLKILHKVDSIIPNYLATKKSVWGQEKAKVWYNIYFATKIVALTYVALFYTPLRSVFTNNENTALNYISQFAVVMVSVLPQAAFLAPFVGVMMLNLSIGAVISSATAFVVNEMINREHFISDANTYSQEQLLQATNEMLAALKNNDGARVLDLYRTYEATQDGSRALVKNNTTVFRAEAVNRRKYFKGTDVETFSSDDEDSAIKTCGISFMACQYPVYVKSVREGTEHKHYYDLFNLLTWLRVHDTNPMTNLKISLADICYDAEAKQAIDALVNSERQIKLSEQQAAANAQNANYSCLQWLRGMSRQSAPDLSAQVGVVNANMQQPSERRPSF